MYYYTQNLITSILFIQQCTDNYYEWLHDRRMHPISIPDKPITKDAVWLALVAQSPEYDQLVHQI